jgi:archaellum component FlaC
MTQHVAHRKSDEIHELRAEVERLRAEIEQLRAINKDVALDIAAAQTKPDLRALLPELAVIAQVVKEREPKPD